MSAFKLDRRAWERSFIASSNVPHLWGPGPWDDDDLTWRQKASQSGDLRPWNVTATPSGGPLHPKPVDAIDRGSVDNRGGAEYRHGDVKDGVLKVRCWCQRSTVTVPPETVAACLTISCGRRRCDQIAGVRAA